jgi:hypothetical protein
LSFKLDLEQMRRSRLLPTLQRIFRPVKQAPDDRSGRGAVRWLASHARFEGSAPFVIGLTFALVAALLGAPRATEPLVLPLPEPHRAILHHNEGVDRTRVERAREQGLPFAVRAVGEALRRFGAAVASASGEVPELRAKLGGLVRMELKRSGPEPLLALRAVQTELFVTATHDWERTGHVGTDLRELGGDFHVLARKSGWLEGQELVLEDDERALLFRMRWNDVAGLADTPPFAPTLDEHRARYALLLRHPSGTTPEERLARQLGYVEAVGKLDHDYPAAFARGVLFYRAQAYDASVESFRAQLAAHPDGPWTLRAKNHLLEALAHTADRD